MVNKLSYAFFGSPEFAAIILRKFIEAGYPPALVIANPNRPVGRKKILTAPPTKQLAETHGIKVFQPERLALEDWKSLPPFDFGVVAAYSKILKREILDQFPRGIIGIHPSLLPRYRGATPIQSALLNGEGVTGVTIYLMDEKMDHGPILASREVTVADNDDYGSLEKKLAETGAALLAENMGAFIRGELTPLPQDESNATITHKFTREEGFVSDEELEKALGGNEKKSAEINRKIHALNPEPGVWAKGGALKRFKLPDNKEVRLLASEVINGSLILKEIQIEGKKPHRV